MPSSILRLQTWLRVWFSPNTLRPRRGQRPATALVQLEQRMLLAGNVTASIANGTLRIDGDNLSNQVRLVVDGGHLVLSGEDGTTINGETTPFRVLTNSTRLTGRLIVDMDGGDDQFSAQGPFRVDGRVSLQGGRGDDQFGLDGVRADGSLRFHGSLGDDGLVLDDSMIAKSMIAYDVSGDQTFAFRNTEVRGRLVMVTGSGDDAGVFNQLRVRKSAVLWTSGGNDTLDAAESTFTKNLTVRTGRGDDFVQVEDPTINGSLRLKMGAGNDSAVGEGTGTVGKRLTVQGAGGRDAAQIDDTITVTGRRTVKAQSTTVAETVISARLDDPANGARPRATNLRNALNPETAVGLTLDTSSNETTTSNGGVLITKEAAFTIEGTTRAGATVAVDLDGDGFDDGTAVANAEGEFSIDLMLTSTAANRGAFTIKVQATAGGFLDSEQQVRVHFAEGTVVRVRTSRGNVDIELLDDDAPLTVANFVSYEGEYEDSIIHRSERTEAGAPFVVQGGGFRLDPDVTPITTQAPIANEFDSANSNVRGTLSVALPPGNPAGGTSQWFINTGNNTFLDAQQHTVFGRVIGDGMTVVDVIHTLPSINLSAILGESALTNVPLDGYTTFTQNLTGTVTVAANSASVTGTGTLFSTELSVGRAIRIGTQTFTVASITNDTELVLSGVHTTGATNLAAQTNAEPLPAHYVRINAIDELLDA